MLVFSPAAVGVPRPCDNVGLHSYGEIAVVCAFHRSPAEISVRFIAGIIHIYDVWGRALARHMGRYIPGAPTITPQNMPGAGTLKLAIHLSNTAAKDGSAFGLISRGIPLEPLLGDKTIPFSPPKMNWIGSPDQDTTVCVARTEAKVQSIADLKTKELTMGGSGSGADTAVYPEFFAQFLGMKLKTVKGYPGSNEIFLAMERGEVDGICVAYDALTRQKLYREKKIEHPVSGHTEAVSKNNHQCAHHL